VSSSKNRICRKNKQAFALIGGRPYIQTLLLKNYFVKQNKFTTISAFFNYAALYVIFPISQTKMDMAIGFVVIDVENLFA